MKNTTASNATIVNRTRLEGLTISYVALEIAKKKKNFLSVWTDIYAVAISTFKILSNLSSPWEKNPPLLNSVFLLDAFKNKEKPDADILRNLYPENEKEICKLIHLITLGWKTLPEKRLPLADVKKKYSFLLPSIILLLFPKIKILFFSYSKN